MGRVAAFEGQRHVQGHDVAFQHFVHAAIDGLGAAPRQRRIADDGAHAQRGDAAQHGTPHVSQPHNADGAIREFKAPIARESMETQDNVFGHGNRVAAPRVGNRYPAIAQVG